MRCSACGLAPPPHESHSSPCFSLIAARPALPCPALHRNPEFEKLFTHFSIKPGTLSLLASSASISGTHSTQESLSSSCTSNIGDMLFLVMLSKLICRNV